MVLELDAKMLNSSISLDGAVVVLSVKLGIVDGGLLDDSEDGPVVLLNAGVIMELNFVFFVRLNVVVDVIGLDGRGQGKDPLIAKGLSPHSILHDLSIIKVDHHVDHITSVSISADVVAFPNVDGPFLVA